MAKKRDAFDDYNRDWDLLQQQIEDRKEQALFARLKEAGKKLSERKVREFLITFRAVGVDQGKTVAEARAYADSLIVFGLDNNLFDAKLDVKPDEEDKD